jgi:ABC-2 type transport system permease protein
MTDLATSTPASLASDTADGDATSRADQLSGFGALLRLRFRLDRLRLALWLAGIVGLVAATTRSLVGLYNTPAELQQYADLVDGNAALIIQAGPGYGLDEPTLGSVLMNELGIWVIIAHGLMSIFLTVRHTRAEEESERIEVIRSTPIGRHAPLAATVVHVGIANLTIAAATACYIVLQGLPLGGSVAFAATLLGTGCVFTAVALVFAQVVGTSRGALGLSSIVLAMSFVLRAVGDVTIGALSWLSPIGWAQAIRAFADERWWVLVLPVTCAAMLTALAVVLQAHRDIGGGMIAQRAGRAEARSGFDSAMALALRLQRSSIVSWMVGLALFGFFYGVVADQAETLFAENPEMAEFFEQLGQLSPTDAFLSTSVLMLALIGSGFSISSTLRLRSEESAMRADSLLSTPTSRRSWALSHLAMAVGGTLAIMIVTGAATGLGVAVVTGDFGQVRRLIGASLAMTPAMFVLIGVTTVLYGLALRAAPLAWACLVAVLIVGLFASILDLPQWVQNISPFEHAPTLPGGAVAVGPLAALMLVAAALVTAGILAFERRDVSAGSG